MLKKLLKLDEQEYMLKYGTLKEDDTLTFDKKDSIPLKEDEEEKSGETPEKGGGVPEEETQQVPGEEEAQEEKESEEKPEEDIPEDKKEDEKEDKEEEGKESEEKPEEKPKTGKVTQEVATPGLNEVYSKMRDSKTPVDVCMSLKSFLSILRQNQIDRITGMESNILFKNENEA